MKIRQGFVSNSSSSSFAININKIKREDINSIMQFVESDECIEKDRTWYIEVHEGAEILSGVNPDTYGNALYDYMIRTLGIQREDIALIDC